VAIDFSGLVDDVRHLVVMSEVALKPINTIKDRVNILCDRRVNDKHPLKDVQVYDAIVFYIIAEFRFDVEAELYYDSATLIFTLVFKNKTDCLDFAEFFNQSCFELKTEPSHSHFNKETLKTLPNIISDDNFEELVEMVSVFWGFEFCARYGNE